MRASALHSMARRLQEIALIATRDSTAGRVSATELLVIDDVAHHPSTSISKITERTGLAQSVVSTIVARWQRHGVFDVETAPSDRRSRCISVNEEARKKAMGSRSQRSIRPTLDTEMSALPASDRQKLHDLLTEVNTLIVRAAEGENRRRQR